MFAASKFSNVAVMHPLDASDSGAIGLLHPSAVALTDVLQGVNRVCTVRFLGWNCPVVGITNPRSGGANGELAWSCDGRYQCGLERAILRLQLKGAPLAWNFAQKSFAEVADFKWDWSNIKE